MGLAYSINATGYVQNAAGISLVLEAGGTANIENTNNPWGNRLGSRLNRNQHNPTMDAGLGPLAFSSGRDIWHDSTSMEIVIRGQQFINDNCVIYGSYECQVFDYHNVSGNVNGYVADQASMEPDYGHYTIPTGIPVDALGNIVRINAWDGFTAVIRARPLSSAQIDATVVVYRMPIELPCGPKSASAAQLATIAADSDVGIWDMDCVHNTLAQLNDTGIPDYQIEESVYNLFAVGYQRGDNDQNSNILTAQTYVPCFYQYPVATPAAGWLKKDDGTLTPFGNIAYAETNYEGSDFAYNENGEGIAYLGCAQMTWAAGGVTNQGASMTQTGARFVQGDVVADPSNITEYCGIDRLLGGVEWSQSWSTTLEYDQTPADVDPTVLQYTNAGVGNANPTKFLSIKSVLGTQSGIWGASIAGSITFGGLPAISPYIIGGEMMSKDTGNDTYPLFVVGRAGQGSKYIPLVQAWDGQPNSNWVLENTGTAYSLAGSYVSEIVLTTDGFVVDPSGEGGAVPYYGVQYTPPTDLPNPTGWPTNKLELGDLVLFMLDNVTHGGNTYGEIYATDFTLLTMPYARPGGTGAFGNIQTGYLAIFPIMVQGGAFSTTTGINPPAQWRGSALQYRTFTKAEERASAYLYEDDTQTYQFGFNLPAVSASSLGFVSQPMGIGVNYAVRPTRTQFTFSSLQRGNVEVNRLTTLNTTTNAQEAKKSVLLFGEAQGGGPYCLGIDPCSWYAKCAQSGIATFNSAWRGGVRNLSTAINSAHTVAPTSTTRQIISASWDNDRDQWIILCADSVNGISFVSFDSDFEESIDQTEFIDTKWNDFAELVNGTGFSATPTGAFINNRGMTNELDGFIIGGVFDATKPKVNLTSQSFNFEPGTTFTDFFSNIYIAGTTGRTARVWVDYLLFDGADSLIAVKLTELGLRVTVENVEWFKAKIISQGDLKMTQEEVEEWLNSQQTEYKDMLRTKERQGRLRRRKRQVSAYLDADLQDSIYGQFIDTEDLRPEEIEKLLKKIKEMPPDREEDKEHFEG